jgi:hypothetical protein
MTAMLRSTMLPKRCGAGDQSGRLHQMTPAVMATGNAEVARRVNDAA